MQKFKLFTAFLWACFACPLTSTATLLSHHRCTPSVGESWEELAPLAGGTRQEHAAVAIKDLIYVIGGLVPIGNPPTGVDTVGSVEVYNVKTNTWDSAAPLPVPMNHPNVAAADGKVYVLGGLSGNINGTFIGLRRYSRLWCD